MGVQILKDCWSRKSGIQSLFSHQFLANGILPQYDDDLKTIYRRYPLRKFAKQLRVPNTNNQALLRESVLKILSWGEKVFWCRPVFIQHGRSLRSPNRF